MNPPTEKEIEKVLFNILNIELDCLGNSSSNIAQNKV
jgi:hypothetical protein